MARTENANLKMKQHCCITRLSVVGVKELKGNRSYELCSA